MPPAELFGRVVLPVLLLLFCLAALGGYGQRARCSVRVTAERFCVGTLLGCAIIIGAQSFILGEAPPVGPVIIAAGGGSFAVLVVRVVEQRSSALNRYLRPRTLVLGSGRRAAAVWRALESGLSRAQLAGFVAIGPGAGAVRPPAELLLPTVPAPLPAYIAANGIGEIVVALDDGAAVGHDGLPMKALAACRLRGVRIIDSASFVERETGRVDLDELEPSWLVAGGIRAGRLHDAAKRGIDVALSLALLLLYAPLLPLVATLIKLDSPGPVFYRQTRVGLNGRPFTMLKFRSMRADAEGDGQARWADEDDPRVTKFGRFLRLSRLDELPQLVNVLLGDMTMVGPRPERPEFVHDLVRRIPFYMERHAVKPGITGWAQVNHPYGASVEGAREKLKYDLYYVKKRSLRLDLLILVRTVGTIIRCEGAR